MRYIYLTVSIVFFTISGYAQNKEITYYNLLGKEISEKKFTDLRRQMGLSYSYQNNFTAKRLAPRSLEGHIENLPNLIQLLETKLQVNIDKTKPIVIIYHPGKDPCNSSGSANKWTKKGWYKTLHRGLKKLNTPNPLYIYKSSQGLDDESFLPWKRDPNQEIENVFFPEHYPCSSFVVIVPNGNFTTRNGEFSKEGIWTVVDEYNNKKN